jgi:chromosome segregation ATPase
MNFEEKVLKKLDKLDDFQKTALKKFDKLDDFQKTALKKFDKLDDFQKTLFRSDSIEGELKKVSSLQDATVEAIVDLRTDVQGLTVSMVCVEGKVDDLTSSVDGIAVKFNRFDSETAAAHSRLTRVEARLKII